MSDFKNNNSTEFKAMGSLADGYTVIPNPVMNDIVNMGPDAFTLLAKIFQYINNSEHKISVRGLATQTKLTKDRVSRGLNKLIELGYIVRKPKKRGNLTIGYSYLVYDRPIGNTTLSRSPEIQDTEIQDTEFTDTNKENNNKYNIKNKNKEDDDDASKLIELYKTFKIEKRVMPHTLKLLKENTHIELDVFEQIFINASEDGIVKKYSYIKSIVEDLNSKKVTTLSDFKKYNDNFKKSKTKNSSKGSSSKTRFHNINQTFTKYDPKDLEKGLKEAQKDKFEESNNHEFHNFNEEKSSSTENSGEWRW
ncbi:MAG: MarR family transcriptional regulator [Paraclostridium sp.]